MNTDLPAGAAPVERILDVIDQDILPLTTHGVATGSKIFGAAIIRKSDLSLVLAATNNEAESPLWHGEVHALKMFFERPAASRPRAGDCFFIATHEPCSLCLSAITWSGFDNFFYLFGHEASRDVFDVPHDANILREIFALEPGGYNTRNAYWTSYSVEKLIDAQPQIDRERLRARVGNITTKYTALSREYQKTKTRSDIPLR
jgi:tRNA(Arg) A34 adenosine deaminase TadA